ncbi:MAG TPA: hypothetical protein VEC35_03655 [Noviherbaspirillum sp.]|nr:hypothetical protein [Noviherbaspirillum sp.]
MTDIHSTGAFDPNRLFDALLDQLELENDEALAHTLHVEPYLIKRIRDHQYALDPSLLIRINEVSGINMRELRQIMGDRRTEYRLETHPAMPSAPQKETAEKHEDGEEREKIRRSLERDDTGLPNFVQWS